jgi:deoxyribodipyrimidine photolyase-related protein
MYLLILPNQLFEKQYIDKKYNIILWECPHYFLDYNYNKKKLILHHASMKYYYNYLKYHGYNVQYVHFYQKLNWTYEYILFNPLNKIELLKLPPKHTIIDTPNILLNKTFISEYRTLTKSFFFNAFYMWSKKKLNIIPNIKSQDKLNRKKMMTVQNISQPFDNTDTVSQKYISIAIQYVQKHFKSNYGNIDNFIFPVTHDGAKKWLSHFIKYKFKSFGSYQDYMHKNDKYLYHSLLSSLLNIGLLNPIDIINELVKYKSNIPINSYEGFIRQLFWREYQYYCYIFFDFSKHNYFNNNKKLTKEWYNGTTKIIPVDDAIKDAFDTGYLHHIKRLMVIGNYMNLCQISPKKGFNWFMEFSCDSYEWVMHQNVYDMVFFVSGGKTMRRPYISSSNYILKMSNYKKDKWSDIWDEKYRLFIKQNKKKLWKFRYYVRI